MAVATVAVLVFQVLRLQVAERYPVPSRSMEPTLHGDRERGDMVLVDKTAWWWAGPERFDLAVFEEMEEGAGHVVKRVVAFGDERVQIRDGDLFVADPGGGGLERVIKDPVSCREMMVTWFSFPLATENPHPGESLAERLWGIDQVAAEQEGGLLLRAAAGELHELRAKVGAKACAERMMRVPPVHHVPGHLGSARQVDASFLDGEGRRLGETGVAVQDAGMEFAMVPSVGCTGLQLLWEHRLRVFRWSYRGDGGITFGEGDAETLFYRGPPLEPGRRRELRFGLLDGRFYLVVDGAIVQLENAGDLAATATAQELRHAPRVLLQVAAAGASVKLSELRIVHDLHWFPSAAPARDPGPVWTVPTGELFVLGDHSAESKDSRAGLRFPADRLLGRPVLILAPSRRAGWLAR